MKNKEEKYCGWCDQEGHLDACPDNPKNTLGTTMEETLKEEFQNVWFANGLDPEHFERVKNEISNWWLEKLSQSKTDLLNALIEREEKEKKKVIPNMLQDDELYQERGMDGVKAHNQAKIDTINHLKSLRDTQD